MFAEKMVLLKKWVPRLIGPALLFTILVRSDVGQIFYTISEAEPFFLLLGIFLNLFVIILRSHRWFLLLCDTPRSGFFEILAVYASAVAIGAVTPGRVGEFIKVIYVRRQGNSFGVAFFSVFLDRMCDLLFLFLFGGALLVIFFEMPLWQFLLVFATALGLLVASYFIIRKEQALLALQKFTAFVGLDQWRKKIDRNLRDFSLCFVRLSLYILGLTFSETVVSWLWNFFAIDLASFALGLEIGYWRICAVSASCALVTMLPISIFGVGTRDAVLIMLLGPMGVIESSAVALSFLILLLNVSYCAFCSGFLFTSSGKLAFQSRRNDGVLGE